MELILAMRLRVCANEDTECPGTAMHEKMSYHA
jgi:hypothetical protein